MSAQKFRGVSQHKDGGWFARIGHQGKHVYLGIFGAFDEAKSARLDAEIRLFGAHFDRRGIELCDDHARIPLHGRGGIFYGWTIVDLADVEKVRRIAWTLDPRGYVAGRPAGFKMSTTIHRWLIFDGANGGTVIDHCDRDKLNNRRSNLRKCSQGENSKNRLLGRNNVSGVKGVSKATSGRWRARIWKDRKEIWIGVFDTIEEAQTAYDKAATKLHGEFASPNERIAGRMAVQVRGLSQA